MKKISKKFKVLILTIILFIISTVFIILNGDTYTIKYNILNGINDVDKWIVEIEDKNIILPVSSWDKENQICISTPAVVGKDGVRDKIFMPLNENETEKIINSINVIKNAISKISD